MRQSTAMLVFAAFALCGCATTARHGVAALPAETREKPARYIVVTIRNEVKTVVPGVSSTSRGYNSIAPYVAGSEARREAAMLATQYHLQSVGDWPIAILRVHCIVYRIAEDANRDGVLDELRHDGRVESAQPLESFTTLASGYNDAYAGLQRNLNELAVPEAQQWSKGEGVRIAVIDTGIASDHADLRGRVQAMRNFVDGDAAQFQHDRHGTAVAGVIAAVPNNHIGIVGIAPQVRLLAYKACWESTAVAEGIAVCNTFTLAQALAAAIEARADVVNLSLAGPSDPLLTRIVRSGERSGIIFVGAVPNSARPGFPVDIEGVIGVQASGSVASSPQFLGAPGIDIFTLSPADHYDAVSGSSLAAAEVSAAAALLRARDGSLSASAVHRLLAQSAQPTTAGAPGLASVNICRALREASPAVTCEIPPDRLASRPSFH